MGKKKEQRRKRAHPSLEGRCGYIPFLNALEPWKTIRSYYICMLLFIRLTVYIHVYIFVHTHRIG